MPFGRQTACFSGKPAVIVDRQRWNHPMTTAFARFEMRMPVPQENCWKV
jgi:hypothetical protein